MDIIPWPVIESKEFYKSFTTLKRRLDLQRVSHPTAGEFLHTIKTLMAKLKVCNPPAAKGIILIVYFRPMTGEHFLVGYSIFPSPPCVNRLDRDHG